MILLKRIVIVIGVILLLAQIPSIYNRYNISRLSNQIQKLDAQRTVRTPPGYKHYSGIIHVHSKAGGDSSGTIEEIADAAKSNGVDFVVMTEHTSVSEDSSTVSFSGFKHGLLFIGGHEMDSIDGNRYLVIDSFPGVTQAGRTPAKDLIKTANLNGSLAFVTHPERNRNLNLKSDGYEVFSLHTSMKRVNPPRFLLNAIWSYSSYPELTLLTHFSYPQENLRQFDRLSQAKKTSLFASTDAHSNLRLKRGGPRKEPWIDIELDPYEETFRIFRTHLYLPEKLTLSRDSVIQALRDGCFYTGFDALGKTEGFRFEAVDGTRVTPMGSETKLTEELRLRAVSPLPARFVVIKDGKNFYESGITSAIDLNIHQRGVYRVEVYQDGLGEPFTKIPWILSNPIYIR